MPENRLAKTLEDPNGLLFGHALKKAASNLDSVRDTHIGALGGKLDLLGRLSASNGANESDIAEVYRLAREIRADAAMFGLKEISRAAHSLCELMVSNRPARQLWEGIAVHVHAITALRNSTRGTAQARTSMLEGL